MLVGLAGGLAGVAGCTGMAADEAATADVVAGPDGRLAFEPERLTAAVGDTITWYFDSPGHNVSCRPADVDAVELPPDAEPFGSYGPDGSPRQIVPAGETYEHTVQTPGQYRYVCVPHLQAGMIGRLTVEA